MADLGAEHLQALPHESGKSWPSFARYEIAVDMGAGRRHIDVNAAGKGHLRLAILQCSDFLAAYHSLDGDQDLHAVADREDRLAGLMEMPHQRLNPLVDADIFRPAPTRRVDRIVVRRVHLGEGLVEDIIVARLFGVGLVALDVMQRSLEHVASLLVRADDMDGVADRMHGLLKDENLVFLAELA